MKTYLECLPCFLNQALKAMDINNLSYADKEKAIREIMKQLSNIDLNKKPPEFARIIYNHLHEVTGNHDPYKEIKKRDNEHATNALNKFKKLYDSSNDSLLIAVKMAIAANIMDFAANSDYNIIHFIEESIGQKFAIDHYDKLKKDIQEAKSIIYLADNAGEVVFDKLLLESIRKLNNCRILLFVKGKPIVNDATEDDLRHIGIDEIPNLEVHKINTGFPNTGFLRESNEFADILKDAHLIISKGQGNYESLSELDANIYFLLIAKCKIIARDMHVNIGNLVCKCNYRGGKENE